MNSINYSFLFLTLLVIYCCGNAEDGTSEVTITDANNETSSTESETLKTSVNTTNVDNLPSYINLTEIIAESANITNATETKNATEKYVVCLQEPTDLQVQLVNDTELVKLLQPNPNITNRETPASCVVLLFYSKYCPFSSMAAPHFNALPRAFPTLKMVAINAMWYHIFNAQNGVVGVPTIILFHNGKPVAKFNDSDYTLELFSRFITGCTGIQPEEKSFVTSADFSGPVSSVPLKEDDMLLFASWMFITICGVYYFTKSKYWKWIVETAQNAWRESEAQAQHEHHD